MQRRIQELFKEVDKALNNVDGSGGPASPPHPL